MKGLVNANFINKMIKNLCVNMILYIPTNVRLFNIIFTERYVMLVF